MLKAITWGQFSVFVLSATGLYYLYVMVRYYKNDVLRVMRKKKKDSSGGKGLLMGLLMLVCVGQTYAQTVDGNQGLNQANTMVRGYYDTATNLMFAIGAILGIVGAIRVFSMWIRGDDRMGNAAAMWFGACVFLVVVATVIKSFFGL
jgi:hypothetical protein